MAPTATASEKVCPPAWLRLCQLRRSEQNHELTVRGGCRDSQSSASSAFHLVRKVLRSKCSKWGVGPAIGELVGKAESQVPTSEAAF